MVPDRGYYPPFPYSPLRLQAAMARLRPLGESWRASFDRPGILARNDFRGQGYRWLVVGLTEGPKGGRKSIAISGVALAAERLPDTR